MLDALWPALVGPFDRTPIDFKTLTRRLAPNDALFCPRRECPKAKPDSEPPVFDLSAPRLREIVGEVALAEADTARVVLAGRPDQDRYVIRTRLLRLPDLADVKVIGLGADRATLALYSRSLVGLGDLGVNRARLTRWLAAISERAGGTA